MAVRLLGNRAKKITLTKLSFISKYNWHKNTGQTLRCVSRGRQRIMWKAFLLNDNRTVTFFQDNHRRINDQSTV